MKEKYIYIIFVIAIFFWHHAVYSQTTTTTTLSPFAKKFIDLCGVDVSKLPEQARAKAQEAKTKAGCP